jgi:hypothetical protein
MDNNTRFEDESVPGSERAGRAGFRVHRRAGASTGAALARRHENNVVSLTKRRAALRYDICDFLLSATNVKRG